MRKILSLLLILGFLTDINSYGLATLPASQNPVVKREILAALQRTQVRYAESEGARALLKANNASCLLLSSGKYLITKEVAENDLRLLRAIVHEDIEALMQILAEDDRSRYQAIQETVLKYFPPVKDNLIRYYPIPDYEKFSRDRYVAHIVATAFEWLTLVHAGIVSRNEIPDAAFIRAIEPIIIAGRSNYFTQDFWDAGERGKKIRAALNRGMRFYQAANNPVPTVIKADDGKEFRYELNKVSFSGYSVSVYYGDKAIGYADFTVNRLSRTALMDTMLRGHGIPKLYASDPEYRRTSLGGGVTALFYNELPAIQVHEDFRRLYNGIGTALMNTIRQFCYENGIQELILGDKFPVNAPEFFEKIGAHQFGTGDNYMFDTLHAPPAAKIRRIKSFIGPDQDIKEYFYRRIRETTGITDVDKAYEVRIPFNGIRSAIIETAQNEEDVQIAIDLFLDQLTYFKKGELYAYTAHCSLEDHMGAGDIDFSPDAWEAMNADTSVFGIDKEDITTFWDGRQNYKKNYCDHDIAELTYLSDRLLTPSYLRKAIGKIRQAKTSLPALAFDSRSYIRHRMPLAALTECLTGYASFEIHKGPRSESLKYFESLRKQAATIAEITDPSVNAHIFKIAHRGSVTYAIVEGINGDTRLEHYLAMLEYCGIKRDTVVVRDLTVDPIERYSALIGGEVKDLAGLIVTFDSKPFVDSLAKKIGGQNLAAINRINDELLEGAVVTLKNGKKIGVFDISCLYGTQAGVFTQWAVHAIASAGGRLEWFFFNGSCGGLGPDVKVNDVVLGRKVCGPDNARTDSRNSLEKDAVNAALGQGVLIHDGDVVTATTLFSDTVDNVARWTEQGRKAVELEFFHVCEALKGSPSTALYSLLEVTDRPAVAGECIGTTLPAAYREDLHDRAREFMSLYISRRLLPVRQDVSPAAFGRITDKETALLDLFRRDPQTAIAARLRTVMDPAVAQGERTKTLAELVMAYNTDPATFVKALAAVKADPATGGLVRAAEQGGMVGRITDNALKKIATFHKTIDEKNAGSAQEIMAWVQNARRSLASDKIKMLTVLGVPANKGSGSGIVAMNLVREHARSGNDCVFSVADYIPETSAELGLPDTAKVNTLLFMPPEAGLSRPPPEAPLLIPAYSQGMPLRFKDMTQLELIEYLEVYYEHLSKIIEEFKPDVIHTNHIFLFNSLVKVIAPWIPVVCTTHGTEQKMLAEDNGLAPLVVPAAQTIERLLSISPSITDEAGQIFGIDRDRTALVGNGYDDSMFRLEDFSKKDILAKLGIIGDFKKVVLFVGKYTEWKGIQYLIDAASYYTKKYQDGKVLTVIVGGGSEELRKRYEAMIKERGVGDSVRLVGGLYGAGQKRIAELMNIADVFVLPSVSEPFGLVLLEAMACGCRVVSTDRGGPPSFFPDELKKEGLAVLVEPIRLSENGAVQEDDIGPFGIRLHNAVSGLLRKECPPDERQKISRAIRHMSWGTIYENINRIYREVMEERLRIESPFIQEDL
ncbi:MAG: glycosyltransferase, partial [Candidatus Omnitrophica bacterium]|nr:glycosyltransferase [Candidatus Omnitrophota bacterium]